MHRGQHDIHAIMLRGPGSLQKKGLCTHSGKGTCCQRPGPFKAHPCAQCPQQKKQRRKKQPVARIRRHREQPFIHGFQQRHPGGKAIIAVAQQPQQIQCARGSKAALPAKPAQSPCHGHAQKDGRQIPQMVKGAVHQKFFEELPGAKRSKGPRHKGSTADREAQKRHR